MRVDEVPAVEVAQPAGHARHIVRADPGQHHTPEQPAGTQRNDQHWQPQHGRRQRVQRSQAQAKADGKADRDGRVPVEDAIARHQGDRVAGEDPDGVERDVDPAGQQDQEEAEREQEGLV
jgi:hypothetical protein